MVGPRSGQGVSAQPSTTMAEITTSLSVRDVPGAPDDKIIALQGGAVSVQITRGYNSLINRYRVDLQQPDGQGGWLPIQDPPLAAGQVPPVNLPPGSPPAAAGQVLHTVGLPAALQGRRLVVLTGSIALPPGTAGQCDVIVALYQPTGATFRRIDWEADSVPDQVELLSRFTFTIT